MPHFLLRLDDGTIIADGSKLQGAGSSGPVMLNAETAYQLGLLKDVHVARLEKLLVELHSKVPNAGPLRSLPSHGQVRTENIMASHPVHQFCADEADVS